MAGRGLATKRVIWGIPERMYHVAWLAKRNPFHDRKVFAEACANSGSVPSVYTIVAWEVDYLQFLFRDARWHWVDDAREFAALKPDVVVFMSNEFDFAGVLDAWTPKILVHLSDEWGRTPMFHRLTERVPLVLRQYRFQHYYRPHNVRHIPLGFMACMFDDPGAIAAPDLSAERRYQWSFVGNIKGKRATAIAAFNPWSPNWQGSCAPGELGHVYASSDFVLCPRGNVSMDCFRNYEATICGAIPVVAGCSKEEYAESFGGIGNPPWVFAETWDAALGICRNLVESGTVAELRKENTLWWSGEIQSLHEAIRSALDGRSLAPRASMVRWGCVDAAWDTPDGIGALWPPARAAFAIFVDCATKARPIPGFSAILPPGMVPHESAS